MTMISVPGVRPQSAHDHIIGYHDHDQSVKDHHDRDISPRCQTSVSSGSGVQSSGPGLVPGQFPSDTPRILSHQRHLAVQVNLTTVKQTGQTGSS